MTRRKTTALARVEAFPVASPEVLVKDAEDYAHASISPATVKTYQRHWAAFVAWCSAAGIDPVPAPGASHRSVELYAAAMGKRNAAIKSIRQMISAIGFAYGSQTNPSPAPARDPRVRRIMKGIAHTGTEDEESAAPFLAAHVQRAVRSLEDRDDLRAARDRALLTLGFSMAARRSELVALDVEDLAFNENGLTVRVGGKRASGRVKRTKANQTAKREEIPIPIGSPECCPVRLTRKWLESSGITSGPVFRRVWKGDAIVGAKRMCSRTVSDVVKGYAAALKLPTDAGRYSGHSLRAGFVTSARKSGVSDKAIMRVTRHKTSVMLDHYDKSNELWKGVVSLL